MQEDYGWKLVWGEVFRPPRNAIALSVLVGNGAQLTTMVGVTLGVCLIIPTAPLHLIHAIPSVRIIGFPFAIKSRLSRYGDAHMLDSIWIVGLCMC